MGKNGANSRSQLQSPIAISRDSVRYVPAKAATLATAESDLEDHLDTPVPTASWTCKKCTLVNPVTRSTCEACGGSKLRSVSFHLEDPTLRKNESWVCPSCTLRNPLSAQTCNACKNLADFLELPRETRINPQVAAQRSPSPRLASAVASAVASPMQKIVTPRHRNSVRKNGATGAANDKRHSKGKDSTNAQWQCKLCTYENKSTNVNCEMCQSSKSLSLMSGDRPRPYHEPSSATLRIQRQESVVMENLRQIEEREALEKWERIVRYCKEVKCFLFFCL